MRTCVSTADIESLGAVPVYGQLPETAGIYFLSTNGVVEYIGQAVNFRSRLTNGHRYRRDRNVHVLRVPVWYLNLLEEPLIREFLPPLNGCHLAREERAARGRHRSSLAVARLGRRWGYGFVQFHALLRSMRTHWSATGEGRFRVTREQYEVYPFRSWHEAMAGV